MSIRVHGATPANVTELPMPEPPSDLLPIAEAAERLGIHPTTLRQWMRLDMEDGKGRVPGGRCEGRNYVVIRAVFDRAMRDGIEPERPTAAAQGPDVLTVLEELIAKLRQSA